VEQREREEAQRKRTEELRQKKRAEAPPPPVRPANIMRYVHDPAQVIAIPQDRIPLTKEKLEYELIRIRVDFVRWLQQFK
jgi:hypothetical protein